MGSVCKNLNILYKERIRLKLKMSYTNKNMNKELSNDLNVKEILEKMKELRNQRNQKIAQSIVTNPLIDKQEDREKFLQNNKVVNVKYLGKIPFEEEIDGEKVQTEKDIYLLIEQKLDEEGNIIEIERFMTEEGEFLAGNNKSDNYNILMLVEKYKGREDLALSLQQLDTEGILDLNELEIENDRIEEIAKALGLSVEDIEALSEIELQQEIEERIKEGTEADISEEERDGTERNEKGKETLTKKQVEKISTKAEMNKEEKVTYNETLEEILGVKEKGYKKIAVVYSNKLQENGSSARFSVVGIKEDGTAEKIDTLSEGRFGKNPTQKVNSLNRDGSEIEENVPQAMFQIKGRKEQEVAVRIGSMGTIEASYVRTDHTKEGFSTQIKTQNIKSTTREVREFMSRSKNKSMAEEGERTKELRDNGAKPKDMNIRNINDNPYDDDLTEDTQHIMKKGGFLENTAKQILKNDQIAEIYNIGEVQQYILKILNSR